jgi:hypothetical protein
VDLATSDKRFTKASFCDLLLLLLLSSSSLSPLCDGFGGLVVSMLASGSRVRGFKPGPSRWIFTSAKILSMPSFGGEVSHVSALRHVKERNNLRELLGC